MPEYNRPPDTRLEQMLLDYAELADRVRILECTPRLTRASIDEGGIKVGGGGAIRSRNFDGTDATDPGTQGWWLGGPDGDAIFNSLVLRKGIIGNDALANPVMVKQTSAAETNFTIATTDEARATTSIPVPSGFSTALVFVVANVGVVNPRTSIDYIYASAVIGGAASREVFAIAGASGGSAALSTAKSGILGGLSGGSIALSVKIHAQGGAWSANAANRAYVEAQAVFLR